MWWLKKEFSRKLLVIIGLIVRFFFWRFIQSSEWFKLTRKDHGRHQLERNKRKQSQRVCVFAFVYKVCLEDTKLDQKFQYDQHCRGFFFTICFSFFFKTFVRDEHETSCHMQRHRPNLCTCAFMTVHFELASVRQEHRPGEMMCHPRLVWQVQLQEIVTVLLFNSKLGWWVNAWFCCWRNKLISFFSKSKLSLSFWVFISVSQKRSQYFF